jgi:hypothetical protein
MDSRARIIEAINKAKKEFSSDTATAQFFAQINDLCAFHLVKKDNLVAKGSKCTRQESYFRQSSI